VQICTEVWHGTEMPVKCDSPESHVKIVSDVSSTKYGDSDESTKALPNTRTKRKKAVSFRDLTVISLRGAEGAKRFHQVE
jgi:hypothetical protein